MCSEANHWLCEMRLRVRAQGLTAMDAVLDALLAQELLSEASRQNDKFYLTLARIVIGALVTDLVLNIVAIAIVFRQELKSPSEERDLPTCPVKGAVFEKWAPQNASVLGAVCVLASINVICLSSLTSRMFYQKALSLNMSKKSVKTIDLFSLISNVSASRAP